MSRPDWDTIFMEICNTIARRSTCVRLQTGSVIVKNNNIISMGYNGVPSKMEHCDNHWKTMCKLENKNYEEFVASEAFLSTIHHDWSIQNELHAEMNAILQSEVGLKGTTIYTLYSPCIQCSKCIVSAKISEVVYFHKYGRDYEKSKFLLEANGIKLRGLYFLG